MTCYIDASVLVALFLPEAHSADADQLLRMQRPVLVLSDFAAAEFASAVGRRVRIRELSPIQAQTVLGNFDAWTARECRRIETTSADVVVSAALLRRFDLMLRTPDALNLAIAQRIGSQLLTFDKKMATAADTLGIAVLAA